MRASHALVLRCAFRKKIQRSALEAISQAAVFDSTRKSRLMIGRRAFSATALSENEISGIVEQTSLAE
jgi:hypothetical protein